jgi:peptide/nickel transport system ATP-binding protein
MNPDKPLLEVRDLARTFDVSRPWLNRVLEGGSRQLLKAVDGVSFSIKRGETLSLVGESGCGKSTVARLICGLYTPTRGSVLLDGVDLASITNRTDMLAMRRRFQMIFQDPYASLNPRWHVQDIVSEPIRSHGLIKDNAAIRKRVGELLTDVGLSPQDGERFPHEFSGGQRQRISIARALSSNPEFLVCDEPTSALDVSVQAQIVDLLRDLQKRHQLAYLFISHDLRVVRALANDVIVMRNGKVVEEGPASEIFAKPKSDYTKALMAAAFNLDVRHAAAVSA